MKPKEYTGNQKSMAIVFATFRQLWSWRFAFMWLIVNWHMINCQVSYFTATEILVRGYQNESNYLWNNSVATLTFIWKQFFEGWNL